MFYNCAKLSSIDISKYTIASSATTSDMFNGCTGLKNLTVPSTGNGLASNACTNVGTASNPCILDYPSGFTPSGTTQYDGYFTWKSGYFRDALRPYAVLDGTTLTFYYDNLSESRSGTVYEMNTGDNEPGWYANRTTIQKVSFNSSFANARPESCRSWFLLHNLTSITGLQYLNTSEVTNMYQMFMGCPLESIDVSHFTTSKVTNMGGMFAMCSNLKEIDLSNFNTSSVNSFLSMFLACAKLTHLDLSGFNISSSADSQNFAYQCSALETLVVPSTADNFSASAFSGVGTASNPCPLVYPDGFTPEKTSTGDGYYVWKSGYFKDDFMYAMGDVNHDGAVGITDVMLTVAYVIGNPTSVFYREQADINGDKSITVSDITSIVSIVIGQPMASAPRQARTSHLDRLSIAANGSHAALLLDNTEPFTAMQLTIVVPEGAEVGNVRMSGQRSNGHMAKTNCVLPGRYNVVVYANNAVPLRDGPEALLTFDYKGCQPSDISIEDAQLVNAFYETVLPEYAGLATAIAGLDDDPSDEQPYYNTVGIATKSPNRGIYIRNGQKVAVK